MKKTFVAAMILSCAMLFGCGQKEITAESGVSEASFVEVVAEEEGSAEEASADKTEAPQAEEATAQMSLTDKNEAGSDASSAATTQPADKEAAQKDDSAAVSSTAPAEPNKQETTAETESPQQPEAAAAEQPKDYGRIFFIGDSRTVDIFDGEGYEIYDLNQGGVRVFAENGKGYDYLVEILGRYDSEYDTVVTWLGCNDHYNIEQYKTYYEGLLARGINLVICNVGPTANECLDEWDSTRYRNEDMAAFNQQITAWANAHGVKVIDMYSYVYSNLQIDSDGIHYSPKPNSSEWSFIMGSM